jgi:hypothetical protein
MVSNQHELSMGNGLKLIYLDIIHLIKFFLNFKSTYTFKMVCFYSWL